VQTGSFYVFSKLFVEDIVARLHGPGRLGFILQPAMATLIGATQGLSDARANRPPFVWAVLFRRAHRRELLREAATGLRNLIAIAILLDVVLQLGILHRVHPAAAVILGTVLIAVPYSVARALSNRIASRHATSDQPRDLR